MAEPVVIRMIRLRPEADADIPLPRPMTPSAVGMDVAAAVDGPVTLPPGAIRRLPTGFAMALPVGYEAQIRPRSGLATRHGVTLINAPGTIDPDYRGEVMISLINLGPFPYTVERGDRIAQMVIHAVPPVRIEPVATLDETPRGNGGFGHTGR